MSPGLVNGKSLSHTPFKTSTHNYSQKKKKKTTLSAVNGEQFAFLVYIWFSDNLIRNARGRSLNEYVFNSHHNLVNKLRDSLGAVRARFFLSDVCFMLCVVVVWSFGGD